MKYFRTVKHVLDAQVPAVAKDLGMSADDVYAEMGRLLPEMTREWMKGSAPNIPYHEPICRLAYVYSHVAINANLFERALEIDFTDPKDDSPMSLGAWVSTRVDLLGRLKVCAFGGGPGTEMIALAKHLTTNQCDSPPANVELVVLDQVPEWSETWEAIKEAVYEQFDPSEPRPVSLNASCVPFDMTKRARFGTLTTLFNRDLFVLNYVISEIFETGALEQLRDVVKMMAEKAADAVFVLMDRDEDRSHSAARDLLEGAGLDVVAEETISGWMNGDEQKSILATHTTALGGRFPRVSWKNGSAFVMLGKKA